MYSWAGMDSGWLLVTNECISFATFIWLFHIANAAKTWEYGCSGNSSPTDSNERTLVVRWTARSSGNIQNIENSYVVASRNTSIYTCQVRRVKWITWLLVQRLLTTCIKDSDGRVESIIWLWRKAAREPLWSSNTSDCEIWSLVQVLLGGESSLRLYSYQ